MTVREAIEQIINDLGEIKVPASQIEDIGFPIARSITGLKQCIQAWDEEDARQKAEGETPEVTGTVE